MSDKYQNRLAFNPNFIYSIAYHIAHRILFLVMKAKKTKTRSCTIQQNLECLMLKFKKTEGIDGCFFTYKSNLNNVIELAKKYSVKLMFVKITQAPIYTLRALVEVIQQKNALSEKDYEFVVIKTIGDKKKELFPNNSNSVYDMLKNGSIISTKSLKEHYKNLSAYQIRKLLNQAIDQIKSEGLIVDQANFNRTIFYYIN